MQVGKRHLVLRQDPDIVLGDRLQYRGQFAPTTTITVASVAGTDTDREAALRLIRDVCWLLSLASMSRVVPYQYEYPPGHVVKSWGVPGVCGTSWPLLDIRRGATVRQFVETAFPAFRRLKSRRRLREVFDTLISAEAGNHPVELSLLTAYICLEMLKDTWARSMGIPFAKGHFWRVNPRTGKRTRYGFEPMLRSMMRQVGMRPGLKLVGRYRNALVHSGGLRLSRQTKSRAYDTAQRLCREYLLRLLGYKGPYVIWGELRPGAL